MQAVSPSSKASLPSEAFPSRVWVILPGGMTSGDSFYTWAATESGCFGDDLWCVLHNPGTNYICTNYI